MKFVEEINFCDINLKDKTDFCTVCTIIGWKKNLILALIPGLENTFFLKMNSYESL